MSESETVGRNEPCPCGSGRKYKRCCGIHASPKLTTLAEATNSSNDVKQNPIPNGLPDMPGMEGVDQNMMLQFAQSMQRLPKGQLQRFQSLVQKAMHGKDVSREFSALEQNLPVELQQMLFSMQQMQKQAEGNKETPISTDTSITENSDSKPAQSKFAKLWNKLLISKK